MDSKIREIQNLNNENRINDLKELLEEKGIRLSHQRLLILNYLALNHTHPTAEKIYKDLKEVDPVISQATVYNTLNLLAEKKIIKELDFNMNSKRYEFRKRFHGHFICEKCGSISDFEVIDHNLPDELTNYDIRSEEIVYRGLCHNCK
ncbi:Fur family transcriptional regulator [Anaerococcus sp. DFU013_CI05]|uniref:Fur family transcriptional regulator n=1 Tax=Anaerococcus sp. AH8042_DFU013_CI05 TaxID=3385202 RepID=UPI003A52189B